jgi:hypothetical protein
VDNEGRVKMFYVLSHDNTGGEHNNGNNDKNKEHLIN